MLSGLGGRMRTSRQEDRPEGGLNISECCTNCCTNPPPERPQTSWYAPEPIFNNNIRQAGSIRNRQVIGSSPIVGSIFSIAYRQSVHHLLHNCCTLARQPPVSEMRKAARCERTEEQHPLLLTICAYTSTKESHGPSKHI